MGWEPRPGTNNMYFTQSKRVDGRVIRQYLGNSPQARELARQCEEMRELRNAERIRQAKKMDRFAAAEAATVRYCQFVDMVLHAVMEENGYHYHRGEWRKRRVPKKAPAEESAEQQPVVTESRSRREPKRRPMPSRRPLDYRVGLMRGDVGRNQRSAVPASRKCQTYDVRAIARGAEREAVVTPDLPELRCAGSGLRRYSTVGQGLDPRPPPALVLAGRCGSINVSNSTRAIEHFGAANRSVVRRLVELNTRFATESPLTLPERG